jgi:hypothetical protein
MRISMKDDDPGYETYVALRAEGKNIMSWTLDGKSPIDEKGDTIFALTLDDEEGYALVYAPRNEDNSFSTDEHGTPLFIELHGEIELTIEDVHNVESD